jgi:hypothetical protein
VTSGAPIYAILVVVWALVLIPMWLRRHDEAQESKSADRFARAMGTLRRSETGAVGAPTPRRIVMPARSAASQDTQIIVTGAAGDPTPTPAARAAARRRRVLAVLVGLLLVTVTVALLGRLPMWAIAVPAVLVVGFLVVARRQVALAADMKRRRERRATLADAARAAEARYADGGARRGGRAVEPAPMSRPERIVASELLELDDDAPLPADAWHAVPTTLPTYVTAPRATRMPRVLDLTHPGQWTGAVMVEQARGTLAAEATAEGEMRVETFEITVPRDPAVRAGVLVEPATYADRYVVDDGAVEALDGEDELDSLLDDPRSGVDLPAPMRRAANG